MDNRGLESHHVSIFQWHEARLAIPQPGKVKAADEGQRAILPRILRLERIQMFFLISTLTLPHNQLHKYNGSGSGRAHGCSNAEVSSMEVENYPYDLGVMGLIPAGRWAFFFLFLFLYFVIVIPKLFNASQQLKETKDTISR